MLLNENFSKEWKEAMKASGYKMSFIAEKMGISRQQLNNIAYRDMVCGRWLEALDYAGYDVEVIIKPKKK